MILLNNEKQKQWQSKTCRKKLIISNNEKNNYDNNSDDLKDGQNHRLEKQKILIWVRNWLGILRVWRIQALHDK